MPLLLTNFRVLLRSHRHCQEHGINSRASSNKHTYLQDADRLRREREDAERARREQEERDRLRRLQEEADAARRAADEARRRALEEEERRRREREAELERLRREAEKPKVCTQVNHTECSAVR